jgi:catechol 2,3-dioxygenase-like lactoylglutathione lyase family enzyme
VITGVHTILFGPDADAIRGFLREVLALREVDAGGGWPIFASPPAELAAHPGEAPGYELYLMCDDLEATMAELRAKGVELTGEVEDQRWGRVTGLKVPGGGEMGLYEPRHPTAS